MLEDPLPSDAGTGAFSFPEQVPHEDWSSGNVCLEWAHEGSSRCSQVEFRVQSAWNISEHFLNEVIANN